MASILIIEDDQVLLETLHYNLEQAGFHVVAASDGAIGLKLARELCPDLLILDVMLPGLDGFSICRTLSKETLIPIIMLTALQDEAHVIAGLELGAIDYIVKPFSLGELLARVRGLLRWRDRQQQIQATQPEVLHVGALRLDRSSRRIWSAGREITLSHKEFDLLSCMMRNAGTVLTRGQLLDQVWGSSFLGSHRTVDVHIRWLREKIEPDPSNPTYIHTVRGTGYRFEVSDPTEGTIAACTPTPQPSRR